jgi:hypothetical protein
MSKIYFDVFIFEELLAFKDSIVEIVKPVKKH